MSEFKGTKGKWEVKWSSDLESTIFAGDKRVCQPKSYTGGFNDPTKEERTANELLICAAPEMLAYLIEISFDFQDERLESLIKKATTL